MILHRCCYGSQSDKSGIRDVDALAGYGYVGLFIASFLAATVLGLKHFVLPLLAFGLALAFGLTPLQSTVLLTFSALPTAPSCYVLAARMGYNGAYVAGLVTLSTLLAMLSLPFALGVLLPTLTAL